MRRFEFIRRGLIELDDLDQRVARRSSRARMRDGRGAKRLGERRGDLSFDPRDGGAQLAGIGRDTVRAAERIDPLPEILPRNIDQ